jgi:hypothetical protein
MKQLAIMSLCIMSLIGGCFYIVGENSRRDRELCEFMESKTDFTREDIDMLYHWMNPGRYDDHNPSERFQKLYNEKIKPL